MPVCSEVVLYESVWILPYGKWEYSDRQEALYKIDGFIHRLNPIWLLTGKGPDKGRFFFLIQNLVVCHRVFSLKGT